MRVRAFQDSDLEELRRIHASQGFGYPFPDLSNPLFLTKVVLIDGEEEREVEEDGQSCRDGAQPFADQGEHCCAPTQETAEALRLGSGQASRVRSGQGIVGAAFLRLTAEAYLLLDPKAGTPRERWEWLLRLHAATECDAAQRGLEDVHAWLPPEIAAKFGKRLTRLGWVRDDAWTPYCKKLGTSDR